MSQELESLARGASTGDAEETTARESMDGEVDPIRGRYVRFNKELLGSGSFKTVYKAFDREEGTEVAWNQFRVTLSEKERARLEQEIKILKSVRCPYVIQLYDSWVDPENRNVVFITEMMTSGTLKQYVHQAKTVNRKAIKRWAKQILQGLQYLHEHNPPIVHRDLKCDNIFIDGHQGEVKIGDLGLSTTLHKSQPQSVVGTPEFMAPEVFDEQYTEKADIYAFGMCMIEMVTDEYPFSECKNTAQVYKRVSQHAKPQAIAWITDLDVKKFINQCLLPADKRPSAAQLLKDPFLEIDEDVDGEQVYVDRSAANTSAEEDAEPAEDQCEVVNVDSSAAPIIVFKLRLRAGGEVQDVEFSFDCTRDKPASVAAEMVRELKLSENMRNLIDNCIETNINKQRGRAAESVVHVPTSVRHEQLDGHSPANIPAQQSPEQVHADPEPERHSTVPHQPPATEPARSVVEIIEQPQEVRRRGSLADLSVQHQPDAKPSAETSPKSESPAVIISTVTPQTPMPAVEKTVDLLTQTPAPIRANIRSNQQPLKPIVMDPAIRNYDSTNLMALANDNTTTSNESTPILATALHTVMVSSPPHVTPQSAISVPPAPIAAPLLHPNTATPIMPMHITGTPMIPVHATTGTPMLPVHSQTVTPMVPVLPGTGIPLSQTVTPILPVQMGTATPMLPVHSQTVTPMVPVHAGTATPMLPPVHSQTATPMLPVHAGTGTPMLPVHSQTGTPMIPVHAGTATPMLPVHSQTGTPMVPVHVGTGSPMVPVHVPGIITSPPHVMPAVTQLSDSVAIPVSISDNVPIASASSGAVVNPITPTAGLAAIAVTSVSDTVPIASAATGAVVNQITLAPMPVVSISDNVPLATATVNPLISISAIIPTASAAAAAIAAMTATSSSITTATNAVTPSNTTEPALPARRSRGSVSSRRSVTPTDVPKQSPRPRRRSTSPTHAKPPTPPVHQKGLSPTPTIKPPTPPANIEKEEDLLALEERLKREVESYREQLYAVKEQRTMECVKKIQELQAQFDAINAKYSYDLSSAETQFRQTRQELQQRLQAAREHRPYVPDPATMSNPATPLQGDRSPPLVPAPELLQPRRNLFASASSHASAHSQVQAAQAVHHHSNHHLPPAGPQTLLPAGVKQPTARRPRSGSDQPLWNHRESAPVSAPPERNNPSPGGAQTAFTPTPQMMQAQQQQSATLPPVNSFPSVMPAVHHPTFVASAPPLTTTAESAQPVQPPAPLNISSSELSVTVTDISAVSPTGSASSLSTPTNPTFPTAPTSQQQTSTSLPPSTQPTPQARPKMLDDPLSVSSIHDLAAAISLPLNKPPSCDAIPHVEEPRHTITAPATAPIAQVSQPVERIKSPPQLAPKEVKEGSAKLNGPSREKMQAPAAAVVTAAASTVSAAKTGSPTRASAGQSTLDSMLSAQMEMLVAGEIKPALKPGKPMPPTQQTLLNHTSVVPPAIQRQGSLAQIDDGEPRKGVSPQPGARRRSPEHHHPPAQHVPSVPHPAMMPTGFSSISSTNSDDHTEIMRAFETPPPVVVGFGPSQPFPTDQELAYGGATWSLPHTNSIPAMPLQAGLSVQGAQMFAQQQMPLGQIPKQLAPSQMPVLAQQTPAVRTGATERRNSNATN